MSHQRPDWMPVDDYRALLDAMGQDEGFMARIEPLVSGYAELITEQEKQPDLVQHSRNVSALGLQVSGTRECLDNALHLPSLCEALFSADSDFSRERFDGLMGELKGLERALRRIRSELPENLSTDHMRDARQGQRNKFVALLASSFREHYQPTADPGKDENFQQIVSAALRVSHDPVKDPQAQIELARQQLPEFFG